MSIFDDFETDSTRESEGVLIDYQKFRVRLRRAGGANKLYTKAIEKAMRPWRKQDIDKEDVSVRVALWLTIFIEACYVEHSWETKVDGEFVKGIHNAERQIVPATKQNVHAVLTRLPELSKGLQAEASDIDHYLLAQTGAAVENLPPASPGS